MNIFLKGKTISITVLNVADLEPFLINLYDFRNKNHLENIIIHFDVMDGDFVPNKGVNIDLIKLVKKYNFFVDVHLMCSEPEEYINKAIEQGADNITLHYEIDGLYENLRYLNRIKESFKKENRDLSIGISVKPTTAINKIFNYSTMCDVILIMCVEPGLGGQKYIDDINNKIETAVKMNKVIQIDGGVNDTTILKPNELGVKSFVIGTYLTGEKIPDFNKILKIEDIINK